MNLPRIFLLMNGSIARKCAAPDDDKQPRWLKVRIAVRPKQSPLRFACEAHQ